MKGQKERCGLLYEVVTFDEASESEHWQNLYCELPINHTGLHRAVITWEEDDE